jgi:hypothetical protein
VLCSDITMAKRLKDEDKIIEINEIGSSDDDD